MPMSKPIRSIALAILLTPALAMTGMSVALAAPEITDKDWRMVIPDNCTTSEVIEWRDSGGGKRWICAQDLNTIIAEFDVEMASLQTLYGQVVTARTAAVEACSQASAACAAAAAACAAASAACGN